MQKHVNLVDLVKSFPTQIFLQNLASIQKRTSPRKFAHLAAKSENGSISNLSKKASTERRLAATEPRLPAVATARSDQIFQIIPRSFRQEDREPLDDGADGLVTDAGRGRREVNEADAHLVLSSLPPHDVVRVS